MITLETPRAARELLDLMAELQADGMDEDTAFIVACAELPALLTVDPAETWAARRVVLFDEAGQPSPAWYD